MNRETWVIEITDKPNHILNGTFGRRKYIESYAAELRAHGWNAVAKPLA